MYQQPYASVLSIFFAFHISLMYSGQYLVKQALECVRHFNYLSGCGCGLDPLLATTMHFFVSQNKVHFSLKNRLTSIIIIIPRIGAIRRVETGNLWILKSNGLLQVHLHTLNFSPVPHSNYELNRTEESNLQPSQNSPNYTLYHSQASNCSCGCSCHQCTLSLLIS